MYNFLVGILWEIVISFKIQKMSLLEDLQWRHAVKAYDPMKKVAQEDLDKILEANRLAPTSSGFATV